MGMRSMLYRFIGEVGLSALLLRLFLFCRGNFDVYSTLDERQV